MAGNFSKLVGVSHREQQQEKPPLKDVLIPLTAESLPKLFNFLRFLSLSCLGINTVNKMRACDLHRITGFSSCKYIWVHFCKCKMFGESNRKVTVSAAVQIKYGSPSKEYLNGNTASFPNVLVCLFGFRKQDNWQWPCFGEREGNLRISIIFRGQNPKQMM